MRHISAAILQHCASLYSGTGRIPKNKTPPSCFSARTISHTKSQWLVPVVPGWPWPGKSTEKLQFVSASGPLGYAPTGIGCTSFLPTFPSKLGSDFKAGRKKSHHHKGAAIWTAPFFFFVLIISQILQATEDQCSTQISLISGTIIWAQERVAVLGLLAYCHFLTRLCSTRLICSKTTSEAKGIPLIPQN